MPMIGSPNAHARNHRVPRSLRATPTKIAHLMIRCRTGEPLLFRMTRNSRLMLSMLVGLSPSVALKLTLSRVGRRFGQSPSYRHLLRVLPMLILRPDTPPKGKQAD